MATNRKFIGEQTPGPREVPSKSMNSNPKFIGENTAGAINRMNPARAFLSGKVSAGLVPVDVPNGCVNLEGDNSGTSPNERFASMTHYEFGKGEGFRAHPQHLWPRKVFGGNRTGE